MHVRTFFPVVLLSACALTACGPSKMNYETGREIVKESPTAKREIIDNCISNLSAREHKIRKLFAEEMKVPVEQVPALACTRIVNAVVSGRLSQSDLAMMPRDTVPPKIMRVLKGM